MTSRHVGRAAIARSPRAPLDLEDIFFERPREDEVLVRLVATGICHTDLVARDQLYPVPQPIVLGHEGSGIVLEVGSQVQNVRAGDHVVMTFASCGACNFCENRMPAYCLNLFRLCFGGARADGSSALRTREGSALHGHFFGQSAFATHAIANRQNVVSVRKDAPLELLGPLGCGVQTGAGAILNALQPGAGKSLAVFGAGTVGLSAIMAARLVGATPLIAVDINATRLEMARELGARMIIDARRTDAVAQMREATGGGVDFALETTGRCEVLRQAIDTLGQRGTCGFVGSSPPGSQASFDVTDVMVGGKTIRGIVQGDSVPDEFIPRMVDLFMDGQLPIDKLIKTYSFDAINQAMTDAEHGVTIKPVVLLS